MPSFEDLVGDRGRLKHTSTLAYWIGSLKSEALVGSLNASQLASVMTTMYDVEEQCFWDEYCEIDEFTDAYFSPIAPVTLASKWCPLDSAEKWLGKASWLEVEGGPAVKAAAALWMQPEYDVLDDIHPLERDEAHFLFLLQLTLHRCIEREENILLVCLPGWCFASAAKNPLGMFGYSALSAGRLYSERVPSGTFGMSN